jgi:hypothetical protein
VIPNNASVFGTPLEELHEIYKYFLLRGYLVELHKLQID